MIQKHKNTLHIALQFQTCKDDGVTNELSIFKSSEFNRFIDEITRKLYEDLREEFNQTISSPDFSIDLDTLDDELSINIEIEYESYSHVQPVEVVLNARSLVYFYFNRDLSFKEYTLKLIEQYVN